MQADFVKNGFNKIVHLCSKTGILKFCCVENSLTSIRYGPLGSLLKENVFKEWFHSMLNNTDAHMFPVEIQTPREETILLQRCPDKVYDSLLSDVVGSYVDIHPITDGNLPFGLAVYGPCIPKKGNSSLSCLQPNTFLRNLDAWNRTSLAFFCPSKKSTLWFHYWSRHRYRWWRKFSSIPSKFTMSDITQTPSGDQQLSLMLEFPWGKERIETITLHPSNTFERWCLKYADKDALGRKNFGVPSTVTCEMELDLAVFAYLTNSFALKWRDGETKQLFQLHVKFAPYKVAFLLENDETEDPKKINDVANHLIKELKNAGISVYSVFNKNYTKSEQITRFDEMGIPYVIVLNEHCLKTGIAGLRNRDTTLQEQVHIAEITMKLLHYLQINVHK